MVHISFVYILALLLASCLVHESKFCDNEESITKSIGWRYVKYTPGKDRKFHVPYTRINLLHVFANFIINEHWPIPSYLHTISLNISQHANIRRSRPV